MPPSRPRDALPRRRRALTDSVPRDSPALPRSSARQHTLRKSSSTLVQAIATLTSTVYPPTPADPSRSAATGGTSQIRESEQNVRSDQPLNRGRPGDQGYARQPSQPLRGARSAPEIGLSATCLARRRSLADPAAEAGRKVVAGRAAAAVTAGGDVAVGDIGAVHVGGVHDGAGIGRAGGPHR